MWDYFITNKYNYRAWVGGIFADVMSELPHTLGIQGRKYWGYERPPEKNQPVFDGFLFWANPVYDAFYARYIWTFEPI